ncbi:hypothetical protein N657DRAFT_676265 [Parathielavia appendiculata]|uniref:Uncharacterized protein n=1 Tax=Parathielavia appendiculata TaxID=2587402 RepID=A0AAN6Z8S0_9PEZI|nr:hypothetical protein N657DRAFT_676265 [Parathielavia appendiculata]
MTGYTSDSPSWYVWLTELSIIPPEYHDVISMISSFFLILALTPIIPIIGLVIYDVSLWACRLAAASWRTRPTTPVDLAGETSTVVTSSMAATGEGGTPL